MFSFSNPGFGSRSRGDDLAVWGAMGVARVVGWSEARLACGSVVRVTSNSTPTKDFLHIEVT